VTVTGEHRVDLGLVQQRQHVASVEHLVSLATGATNRHRVPGTERSLVLEVADMTGVLIPGHRHHVRTGQRLELLSWLPMLVGVALVGDIPGDHDDVEGCIVDFGDRVAKQRPVVTGAADVDVRELSDQRAGEAAWTSRA
jgi:hypothetical protein